MNPKFSADGQYMTFMAVDDSQAGAMYDLDVFVYDFVTNWLENITSEVSDDDWHNEDPAFNPEDSSEIVYKRRRGAESDLWIASLDLSTLTVENRQLTETPSVEESGPLFSPDGEWLTYWTGENDEGEIRRGKLVEDEEGNLTLAEEEVLLTGGTWYPAYVSDNELLYTKTSWHWVPPNFQQDDVYAYNLQEQTTTPAAFNRGLETAYPDENDAFKIGNDTIGFSSSREGLLFRNADIYFGTLTRSDVHRLEASTDDLDDLGGTYSDTAVYPPEEGDILRTVLESHADLHIYDPEGRHLGVDYNTATLEEGIPEASLNYYEDVNGDGVYVPEEQRVPSDFLSIPTDWVQVATLPSLLGGDYRTELVGTSNGPFELTLEGWDADEIVSSESFAGDIVAGQTYVTSTTAMSVNGVLTLLSGPLNAAPMVTNVGISPSSIPEDAYVTVAGSFLDPDVEDEHTIVISWGDGSVLPVTLDVGVRSFSYQHQYLDDGPSGFSSHDYEVSVTISDDVGGDTETASVTVNNMPPEVAPIVGPTPGPGVRGQTLTFSASFTDQGTLDTHEVQWVFGDGTVIDFHPSDDEGALTPTHAYTSTGTFTVTLTIRDDDMGVSTETKDVAIQAVALQEDALYPGQKALAVGGGADDDHIVFTPGESAGQVQVILNGVVQGSFEPTSRLVAFGQGGNDTIQVAGALGWSAWLYGGIGNDRIKGGAGHDLLFGGLGDDLLLGGRGRDVMIGDRGKDRIVGNAGDDIMIGGMLSYADRDRALRTIMDEWTSGRDYATRIRNLSNGVDGFFLRLGETVTNDDDSDLITGSSGLDWFFFDFDNDRATDLKDEQYANDLSWILAV